MARADPDLPGIARSVAAAVRAALAEQPGTPGRETLSDPADLKSAHAVDDAAAAAARRALGERRCSLYIEGEASARDPGAELSIYIDPLDGSLNWDRGIGDPAFVLAAAPGPEAATLDALTFAHVEGLRSGDRYWVADGRARYRCARTGGEHALACDAPAAIAEATGYLRCGYGGARRQLAHTLGLFLAARDLRAVDNAGTELCEVARNAAHFMVEARGISDGYNLLAWPVVRAAGGVLLDLAGNDLPARAFDPAAPCDYVLAGSRPLADALVACMARCEADATACVDAVAARVGAHDPAARD